jgi:AcrR family transcriptional regulator
VTGVPNAEQWRGDPLPRGRHKLSPDEVLASQRARLLRAMLECVGEQGYAETTVPLVVARARVSRNGFYALFSDKLDCFLALCDELADELLGELLAFAESEHWQDALADGMGRYLGWWRDRPSVAKAYLMELPAAGSRALEQRTRQFARFEEMFRALAARARTEQPSLAELNPLAPRLLVTGITELVATEVRAGHTERLDELRAPLTEIAIGLLGPAYHLDRN